MNARRTVAVVGGGTSEEHEVSLASAAGVAAAFDPRRWTVVPLTVGRDGIWARADRPLGLSAAGSLTAAVAILAGCDVVFPVLHGRGGEDGTLAALCTLADLPQVGSPVAAGAIALDKWVTKLVAQAVGVAVAPGVLVRRGEPVPWRGPVVVKPVTAGSSHGVRRVDAPIELPAALASAYAVDDRVLVEQRQTGREVDIAVLICPDGGLRVSPPLEVVCGGVFDTTTKYDGSARFLVPAQLTAAEQEAVAASARRVFSALGCDGVARLDFFLTPDGPVLNEVNTAPGMTARSQVPRMFAAAGVAYPELVDLLADSAIRRHRSASC